jgi:hypothetical protein
MTRDRPFNALSFGSNTGSTGASSVLQGSTSTVNDVAFTCDGLAVLGAGSVGRGGQGEVKGGLVWLRSSDGSFVVKHNPQYPSPLSMTSPSFSPLTSLPCFSPLIPPPPYVHLYQGQVHPSLGCHFRPSPPHAHRSQWTRHRSISRPPRQQSRKLMLGGPVHQNVGPHKRLLRAKLTVYQNAQLPADAP